MLDIISKLCSVLLSLFSLRNFMIRLRSRKSGKSSSHRETLEGVLLFDLAYAGLNTTHVKGRMVKRFKQGGGSYFSPTEMYLMSGKICERMRKVINRGPYSH